MEAVSGNSFIKTEQYISVQLPKLAMGKKLPDNSIFKWIDSLKKCIYQMMQKEWKNSLPFPSPSAQFQIVILYFTFAAPPEQLYSDTFPLVFLKFLSLLPDSFDPSNIKSSLNGRKLLRDFVQRTKAHLGDRTHHDI